MDKAEKVGGMVFVADNEFPEIEEPGKEAFDLPSSFVPPQRSAVLRGVASAFTVGRDHLDPGFAEDFVEEVAVVRLVPNKALRLFGRVAFRERVEDQGDFGWRSRLHVEGDRKTRAVCHCHELRTFAPLGGTHATPPFLAVTNVPSMKHSETSILPRSAKSSANASRILRNTPAWTHCW